MNDVAYKLDELAQAAGTSPRTVRYYVQRGLLPAPAFRGKDTAYGAEHLIRLRAIRRLQEAFLPLDAIAVELASRSLAELERIAAGDVVHAPPAASLETIEPAPRARTFERVELAPGVELSIAQDAPDSSRRLVEKILALVGAK